MEENEEIPDVSTEYVGSIRKSIRTSSADFDDEIEDLIKSARKDLQLDGILQTKTEDEGDSLIKRAITTYVKAEFGLDNPDSEKYRISYESQKTHLSLSSEYTIAEVQ